MDSIYASFYISTDKSQKINSNIYKKNEIQYNILNYDKNYICYNETEKTTHIRSVILSYPEEELLSFSPPKTSPSSAFCKKYELNKDIAINEFIDGTLVHLFFDERINKWEIASKNAIGGNYRLKNTKWRTESEKGLIEMFTGALIEKEYGDDISSINHILNRFSKQYCYNFVLLHPKNPIVLPIDIPKLYLVAVYDIMPKMRKANNIPFSVFQRWSCFKKTSILFPIEPNFSSWDQLNTQSFEFYNTSPEIAGYCATHLPTGNRCVFYNPIYKELLRFKTMDPQRMFQYLSFKRTHLLKSVLMQFPEFRKKYLIMKEHFIQYMQHLHCAYLHKYVWKTGNSIPEKYNNYVDEIHKTIYIPSLRKKKITISQKIVHDFLLKKHPGELLYKLFTEKRLISLKNQK